MKKIILLTVISLIMLACRAQENERAYHFGLFFNPNLSWLKPDVKGEVYSSEGTMVGYSYGAAFEYDFTPNVGIVTGFDILRTGGRLQYRHVQDVVVNSVSIADTGILSRKYILQYIEIPLMLKGSTGDLLGKFSFFGKFGLGSGFNFKAKAKDEFRADNSTSDQVITDDNINAKKDVSFFRESMIIGIGAEYRLGKTAILQMGLTFSNGFTDVLKGSNSYTPTAKEKARSNFVELNLGVMF